MNLLARIYRYIMRSRNVVSVYLKNAHPKTFNWDWGSKGYTRIAFINALISNAKQWHTDYLEIGCCYDDVFKSVPVKNKVGVDPMMGGTHRMTSDDFFAQNNQTFDVMFIDGLHEYQQVRRDAINALDVLNKGGVIAFHDMLPSNWKEALPDYVPVLTNAWTGDVWKLAVELNHAKGLEFYIVDIDYGVGFIRKKSDKWSVPDMSDKLLNAKFDAFVEHVNKLPIIPFEDAMKKIQSR